MATTLSESAPSRGAMRKAALIVVGGVALYFAYYHVLRYFVWNEETYAYSAMIWPVWVLPLLGYELFLQYRER
jgi:hypothetical protein